MLPVFIHSKSRSSAATNPCTVLTVDPYMAPLLGYMSVYTYMPTLKYSMSTIPSSVPLLYTANLRPYTARSYSTTVRDFEPDPLLQPKPVVFQPLAPLLDKQFQVDKSL